MRTEQGFLTEETGVGGTVILGRDVTAYPLPGLARARTKSTLKHRHMLGLHSSCDYIPRYMLMAMSVFVNTAS